jgi:hypothetical protein
MVTANRHSPQACACGGDNCIVWPSFRKMARAADAVHVDQCSDKRLIVFFIATNGAYFSNELEHPLNVRRFTQHGPLIRPSASFARKGEKRPCAGGFSKLIRGCCEVAPKHPYAGGSPIEFLARLHLVGCDRGIIHAELWCCLVGFPSSRSIDVSILRASSKSLRRLPLSSIMFLVMAFGGNVVGQTRFSDLVDCVPASANTLVVLHVDHILSSPLAVSEGWRAAYEEEFDSTPMMVPPKAKRFVLASHVDLKHMQPRWEVAVMELSRDFSVEELAERFDGELETLAGKTVVLTSFNAYVVRFAPRQFGFILPPDRNLAIRWQRNIKEGSHNSMSPYLRQALGYAEDVGTEIVMAIDMRGIAAQRTVRHKVTQSVVLRELDQDKLTELFTNVQGITVGMRVGERINGKIKIDFDGDAGILQQVAKPVMLEFLQGAGAMLDEFENWKPAVSENHIAIAGPLSREGMRRMLSVLSLHSGISERPGKGNSDSVAKNSQRYFKAVNRYLDIVQNKNSDRPLEQVVFWIDRYARRISRLPRQRVDEDLLAYSDNVVRMMQDAVGALHGVSEDGSRRVAKEGPDAEATTGVISASDSSGSADGNRYYQPRYSPFADGKPAPNDAVTSGISEEKTNKGLEAALKIRDQILAESEKIRRAMSKKYRVDF